MNSSLITEARALIAAALVAAIVIILFSLFNSAHGADYERITECRATRESDRAHWAWREIDGRRCWYQGAPGRSKYLLRWSPTSRSGAGVDRPEVVDQPDKTRPDLGADSTTTKEATWQANPEDQERAYQCCWPELEHEPLLPQIAIPSATWQRPTIWKIVLIPVMVLMAVVALAAKALT